MYEFKKNIFLYTKVFFFLLIYFFILIYYFCRKALIGAVPNSAKDMTNSRVSAGVKKLYTPGISLGRYFFAEVG